jgi:hypothetical protein
LRGNSAKRNAFSFSIGIGNSIGVSVSNTVSLGFGKRVSKPVVYTC